MARWNRLRRDVRSAAILFWFLAASLAAQEIGAPSPRSAQAEDREAFQRRTYGTADNVIHQITAASFQLRSGGTIFEIPNGYGYIWAQLVGTTFAASLNLPNGALVSFLDLYSYDADAGSGQSHDVSANLFEVSGAAPPQITAVAQVRSSGSAGYRYDFHLINPPLRITNQNRYYIQVENADGSDRALGAVNVWYKLEMSPAPVAATFADVPTSHLYFRAIEALAASGITTGCGAGNFCPSQNVTRGEMAAFLARALGLHWPF
jgi:hypothetical protein